MNTNRLKIVQSDSWLEPVEEQINLRYNTYKSHLEGIERNCGSIVDYANGYK
jgi:hypothetical protein